MDVFDMLDQELDRIKTELDDVLASYRVREGAEYPQVIDVAHDTRHKVTHFEEDGYIIERIGIIGQMIMGYLLREQNVIYPQLGNITVDRNTADHVRREHEEIGALVENFPFIHIDEPEMFVKLRHLRDLLERLGREERLNIFKHAREQMSDADKDRLATDVVDQHLQGIDHSHPAY